MKVPLGWLKEWVAIDATVEELSRRLTFAGVEIENIEVVKPVFAGVYVARVIGAERHPNADRLRLCEVDAGPQGRFKVVCGAPNARGGMIAALAKIGARLGGGPHGPNSGNFEDAAPLEAAVIRGIRSEGMLCSEAELGLSKDHTGILELPNDAPVGEELTRYLQLPETVLDIAITPNRGDCLSILGLAREVAALFGTPLKPPQFKPITDAPDHGNLNVTVEVQAPDGCPRYAALAMTGVRIGPSPAWLRRRLELCGMRSLNNVVDVTNYVMLELGQPLHAFDADQIAGQAIVVRRAGSDREFTTLDNLARTLDPSDLMIADPAKPLALAGVMGGLNSEISGTTTRIVLESAYFEPMTIARTARRLGLRSEASYRFERSIDRDGQIRALERAAELIALTAEGHPAGSLIDVAAEPARPREIIFDLGAIRSLLGAEISAETAASRLKAIGATVMTEDTGRFKVIPPSFRPDLSEAADLAEEIARIAGLSEIPAAVPSRPAIVTPRNPAREFTRRTREVMAGCGLAEIKTIAFIAPIDNQRFAGLEDEKPLQVANPLSAELSELRRSLLPGLLAALRFNLNHEAAFFHAFEIGKVFGVNPGPNGGVAREHERLAGLSYGDYAMRAVGRPAIKADFWTGKGIVEAWLRAIGAAQAVSFEAPDIVAPLFHPGRAALIKHNGEVAGILGELHPAESLRLELGNSCVLFEVSLRHFTSYGSITRQVIKAPPKYPAIRRDLALVLDRDIPANTVVQTITSIDSPLLESVELFDVYEGSQVPQGKKSVALACRYRGSDRTLTDDEVNRTHSALVERANSLLGAVLR
ncbi:MAG TPA: phenylalanine--tRNA ligase subunit beta [Candidatus Binataceae bacterium]|nr:phenylalanine--tRNA ligase subunit beta [Candidatus Binataceae bacterium]